MTRRPVPRSRARIIAAIFLAYGTGIAVGLTGDWRGIPIAAAGIFLAALGALERAPARRAVPSPTRPNPDKKGPR